MTTLILITSLLIVITFCYKPAKKILNRFFDEQKKSIVLSLQEAEQDHEKSSELLIEIQSKYKELVESNKIKLSDLKKDLIEVNKDKALVLKKNLEQDLVLIRTFYEKELKYNIEILLNNQLQQSVQSILNDFSDDNQQKSFLQEKMLKVKQNFSNIS